MPDQPIICLYGGAFDPVHNGHLRIAFEALQALDGERLYFVPTGQPAHRDSAHFTAQQRLDFLSLALQKEPRFELSDFEIQRASQGCLSYAVDTAVEFKKHYPKARLCWLMGSDAFGGFTRWHRWQDLLTMVNVIVAGRPSTTGYNADVNALLQQQQISNASQLPKAGGILPLNVTQLDISSTAIREQLAQGVLPKYLVPDELLSTLAAQTPCQ